MEDAGDLRGVAYSPSFRYPLVENAAALESPQKISAAVPLGEREAEVDDDGDDSSEDFEFALVLRDPKSGSAAIDADEIFSNGQIRPVYPVFDRSLLLAGGSSPAKEQPEKALRAPLRSLLVAERQEEPFSRSGSLSSDDLEGIPSGTYCVWAPRSASAASSPDRCRKSSSTGSSSIRLRLLDLVVGRSHSDGKEKFVFLAAEGKPAVAEKEKKSPDGNQAQPQKKAVAEKDKKAGRASKKVTSVDMVTAHRLYYGKAAAKGSGRKSFLPYRPDVGLFANVNGFGRAPHHPF